ncbi:hypothetical protein QOZ80_6BG0501330 [Eleusine coracana subsp. coracana]|nr:hypothetical protein QOZ80_6BG0501330 [Eleusine coracana subsp. coracana]
MDVQFDIVIPSEFERRYKPGIRTRIVALATDATVMEVSFTCRVLDQIKPGSSALCRRKRSPHRPGKQGHAHDTTLIMSGAVLFHPGCDSIIVECVITVQHKCVLAAQSPVSFMAELFGDMKEISALQIEIEDMDADVFRALIKLIYTDTLPELVDTRQEDQDTTKAMAQHLLAAADRYGMERLKRVCEDKIYTDISVSTAAAALVLAEQHGCSKLKARYMEFIVTNPTGIQAIVATDGYTHLMERYPLLASELLVAAVKKG